MNLRANASLLPVLAAALLASACTVGPNYHRPMAPVPTAFKEAPPAGWKQAKPSDSALRGNWWELYKDPLLSSLEEQVAVNNQNVLVAEAQFRQAQAAIRVARSALYPVLSGSPSIAALRSPSNFATGGQVASSSGVRGSYNLPFSLSWEPDLWGNIHRAITQSSDLAQVSAANLANVKLLYQISLAQNYFQLKGLDADQELLEASVESYRQYLQLTRDRYASGVASMADVEQALTQVETTRAQLVDLGVLRSQYEHAIAILTGKPPASLAIARAPIKALPPAVPITLPSELLERRPDIAAAERQVAAANEQIGIAQAAYYPTVTLSASGGSETSHFLQFLTWPSRFWSVGPQLAETLFDAGRRHAVVTEARANYDSTVASYRQTVLNAFQQVEDNLSSLRVLEQEADVEAGAVKAAEDTLTISTNQYKGGVVSYLQVITAQNTALQDERSALDILTRRMVSSVLLVEALGGGWDASKIPSHQDLMAMGK